MIVINETSKSMTTKPATLIETKATNEILGSKTEIILKHATNECIKQNWIRPSRRLYWVSGLPQCQILSFLQLHFRRKIATSLSLLLLLPILPSPCQSPPSVNLPLRLVPPGKPESQVLHSDSKVKTQFFKRVNSPRARVQYTGSWHCQKKLMSFCVSLIHKAGFLCVPVDATYIHLPLAQNSWDGVVSPPWVFVLLWKHWP